MVQIDYMEKPDYCYECPLFIVSDSEAPVYYKGKDIRGAYTRYRRCAFAYDHAERYCIEHEEEDENYEGEYDSLMGELMDKSIHADTDKDILNFIEPWCPIKEV